MAGREPGGRPGREAGGKPAAGRAGCADAAAADTITGVGCPPARYDAIADWYAEFSKDWAAGPADVLSVLHHLRDNFRQLGPEVANGLVTEASDIPADVFQIAPRAITAILARAADRGEVRPEKITPLIARLPADLLRHEMMLLHGDPPDAFLAEILDEVFIPLVIATPEQQEPRHR